MKLHCSGNSNAAPAKHRRGQHAYLLLECLAYMAVLAMIAMLAYTTCHRYLDHSRELRRHTEDILHAMRAGEQWRRDVRASLTAPQLETRDEGFRWRLSQPGGSVVYDFSEGVVWRRAGSEQRRVFERVHHSELIREVREHVTGWRWEVELQPRRETARVKPLFTCIAANSKDAP
jgi:type II secretory pathway component PulJ